MTGLGHTKCGVVLAIYPAMVTYTYASNSVTLALLAALLCIIGATAPDWLEIPRGNGGRVIPHRTLTHIIIVWVGLATWAYWSLTGSISIDMLRAYVKLMDKEVAALVFGFCCGGLVHLAGDIPNKQAIPIFGFDKGFSLNLWASGKNETLLVVVTAIVTLGLTMPYVSWLSNSYEAIVAMVTNR